MQFRAIARAIRLALIVLLSLYVVSATSAQESSPTLVTPTGSRPRIGLALSGGGALGLVEIGVIQWMEEHHIPVDSVAGTSMGAIIGSMYASGMTPAEITEFARTINWEEAFLPDPNYRQIAYRRKLDRRDFQINAPLGLKHGLSGPNGFNPGQEIGLLLDRIAWPTSSITNFDDLPIPFRCVATDMTTGEAVILKDGSLAQAVRASMAIPGVFTPVELKGRVLADGGMVQNIPVETVRTMNVDATIAIELRLPPGDVGQLQTITGVLSRAIDVMITQNERLSLALAQAKVSIDMAGFTINDYSRIEELIQLGYKSADHESANLLRYAISDPAEWQHYLDERQARRRPPVQKVDSLEVVGADPDADKRIQQRVRKAVAGSVDFRKLETQLTRIAGEGEFDRLGYEGFTQNGLPALRITAHEKTYGPPFVDLAVNVQGSGVAAFDFSAGTRITFMDIAHHGGEWRNDLLFGSSNLAASEFYQPILESHFFLAPYAFATKFARNSFTGITRVAVFGDERGGGGLDLGHIWRLSEFRVGYEIFSGKLTPLIGSAGLPIISGNTGEFRARYVWDDQDSPSVPSSGSRVVVTASHILQTPGAFGSINQLDVQSSNFIPVGPKTSIFVLASGGTTFRGGAGPFQVFALGGPFRLGAYLPQEFLGNHYSYGSLGFHRQLFRLPQLLGRGIYWGGWYEAGTAFGTTAGDAGPVVVRGSFNAGVIADTIVGPITLSAAASPTGQSRVNFSIGRIF